MIPTWGQQRGGATLSLDFINNNSVLDSRITFSRASSATMYDSTGTLVYAPMNLLTYSEQQDNVIWVKTGGAITPNTITAPDGNVTADSFIEDTSTGAHNLVETTAVADNTSVTVSAFVKPNGRSWVAIAVADKAGANNRVWYNISTGTQGTTNGTVSAFSATALSNGWYRLAVTASVSTGAQTPGLRISMGSADNTASYTGDGTSGIYVWGAQLNLFPMAGGVTSSLTTYYPTTTAAYQGPRFDYNPSTLAARGLLIEEARTNSLTYSDQFDNAAWGKSSGSVSANAGISPDGTQNADLVSSTGGGVFRASIAVTNATAYTATVFAKQISGTGQFSFGFDLNPSNGRTAFNLSNGTIVSNGASVTSSSITPVGNGWYRCSVTATSTSTTLNLVYYNSTSGTSWLMYGAQLEAGAFATSYIPTTTATATRSADVASMTGTNFSSWYNQSQGTIFVDAVGVNVISGATRRYVEINDNSSVNRLALGYGFTTSTRFLVSTTSIIQADISVATTPTPAKMAATYKSNDFQQASNGVLGTADTSGTAPTVSQMNLGADSVPTANTTLNGWLRRISYYPIRLPDGTLQGLTA